MEQMVVDNFSEIEINLNIKGDFENDTDSSDTEHSNHNDTDIDNGVDQQTDVQETNRTTDEQVDRLPEIGF